MSSYEIWLTAEDGDREALLDTFTSLEYSRRTNDTSWLQLVLPDRNNFSDFERHKRIEVHRTPNGGASALDTETAWIITKRQKSIDAGRKTITIGAVPAIDLLRARHVLYAAGSSQAQKSGSPDSMLRELAVENLGSSASGVGRDLSAHIDFGDAVGTLNSITKTFAWSNLLQAMQEIAEAARDNSEFLYFDITYNHTTKRFNFQTYIGQRGTDHSRTTGTDLVLLSPEWGNLAQVTISYDWSNETTLVEVLGRGEGDRRDRETVSRSNASDFWRIERTCNASSAYPESAGSATATAIMQASGNSVLEAGRPQIQVAGQITETQSTRYGVDWKWGDCVTIEVDGITFDARIEGIQVSVKEGGVESIQGSIEYVGT